MSTHNLYMSGENVDCAILVKRIRNVSSNTASEKKSDTHETGYYEKIRLVILDEMLSEVVFDGWTSHSLTKAAFAAGMSPSEIERGDLIMAFPKGIGDILDFWSGEADKKMLTAYAEADPAPTRIRDKVRFLVKARLEALDPHREAARRAAATLALSQYAPLSTQLTWRTADKIWRVLGDTSTDYNFYTKRATLSAVYLSTLTQWLANDPAQAEEALEETEDPNKKTWEFLDERIENIMQFEKVKGRVVKAIPDPAEIIGFLGKMRYGAGKN